MISRSGRIRRRQLIAVLAASCGLCLAASTPALAATDTTQFAVTAGALAFVTVPDVPNLPGLTLNGQAQTLNATMGNFSVVDATGSASGWHVSVQGDSGAGKSAVFKQYCTITTCGSDSLGYVSGGATLAANSLLLTSTGGSFSALLGTTGIAPTHQCGSGCNVDSASAVNIVSAATSAGMGTYATTGYNASSVALSAPTTVQSLPASEVYRADLVWTLSSGP
jgi:putative surface cell wall-binding protein